MFADKVILGKIYTGDKKDTVVSALAIKDEKIVYAGDKTGVQAMMGPNTEVTTLTDGQLVTAGFMDGHCHLAPLTAAAKTMCTLSHEAITASPEATVAEIAAFVKAHPEMKAYVGHNWYDNVFEEACPTADLLDAICPDKPMYIMDCGGHSAWTNTALMRLAGITKDTPDPEGGKIERYADGTPKGCFRDTAEFLVSAALPQRTPEELIPGLLEAQEIYHKLGYTGFFDALSNNQATPTAYPMIQAYEMLNEQGKLDVYTQASFVVNNTPDAVEVCKLGIKLWKENRGGMFDVADIKLFIDGVVEGVTAYLKDPYAVDPSSHGACRWAGPESHERLTQVIATANEAGMPCHFHCMGDAATCLVLDCMDEVANRIGLEKVKTVRNAITHLGIVDPLDIPRFRDLGVTAVLNPWGMKTPGFYKETECVNLGEERASKEYPYQSFLNTGVKTSFGTDYGCSFVADPVECYHVLATRTYKDNDPATKLNPPECLSRADALKVMTINTAWQMGVEDRFGTLEKGKVANLVILSQDLLTVPDDEIMSTKLLATMCNGHWAYKA